MRAAAVGLLWMMVAVGLSGCAGGDSVSMAQPLWASGFAWTFAVEESYSVTETEDGEDDTWNETERTRVVYEVMNTTLEVGGEPLYVVAAYQPDEGRREVVIVRQRDLSSVPHSSMSTKACNDDVCAYSFVVGDVNTTVPTYLDFPLERGKRWGGSVGDEIRFVYQASVDGAYMVETPLGRASTARVTIVAELADPGQLRRDILAEAAEDGYRVDELRLDISSKQVVFYSEDYQTVIRSEQDVKESFYARGRGPDGEPFEFAEESRYGSRSVVEGARLLARPERNMDQVAAFMSGELDLRDPSGHSVGAVDYKLMIDPPQATINVGAGEEQMFSARVNGTLGDGHTLAWRVVDAAGDEVATGRGAKFTAAPATPGIYSVELEAVHGGAAVAAAGARLTGNWHQTQTVDCGPVVAADACVETTLPVFPGIQRLHVRATPQGTVPGVSDTLWVRDSAGQQITGSRSGDSYTVTLEPVAGYLVDRDAWEMEFRRTLGVASSVEVEVEALYGAMQSAAPEMSVRTPHVRIGW